MLRVLLINPPVLAVLEPWYDTPKFGRLALAYLASYLRQHPGFDIKVIDAKLERLDFAQVQDAAAQWKPDVVGLTAFTNEIKPAAYQAALIKRALPQAVTVIGGVHVTALPEQTMGEFPSFDVGVVGEGERTFHELCEALAVGRDLSPIAGLAFRKGGRVIVTEERERILDQDSIPYPAWDLFPRAEEYPIQSLRGCPFNCIFCMNPNGRFARKRSVENVIGEIQYVVDNFHPQWLRFGDEIFSVDMDRTRALMDAMIQRRLGERVKWFVQTHVRYVDYDLFIRMKEAGVARVEMGVETGMEESLKTMGKGTTVEMIETAFAAAKKAGVTTGAFFLLGQPNETPESMRKTMSLAARINPHLPMFGLMTPYPGTEVAKLAAKGEGGYRLLTTDWDEYNKQIGGAMEFANLSRGQIERLQIRAYLTVFLRNLRFLDLVRFLWEYRAGVLSVLKKNLTGQKSFAAMKERPADYDAAVNGVAPVVMEDIVKAREAWVGVQKRELMRAKATQGVAA